MSSKVMCRFVGGSLDGKDAMVPEYPGDERRVTAPDGSEEIYVMEEGGIFRLRGIESNTE